MNKVIDRMMRAGSGLLSLGIGLSFFTFVVDGGERAIMFDTIFGTGVGNRVLGEGIHFRFPLVYEPIKFSVRMNPHVIETKTSARDLQTVNISVRILERPNEEFLPRLYLDQMKNYAERVLPNITHETIKAVVARYNPDQLITQRTKVSEEIAEGLRRKAEEYNIILDDVAIIHIEFSKEYREAIEMKQVQQQHSER